MGSLRRHPLRTLRDDQSGFGLIEVLVSALLLTLVATGVYYGLDAASATSGINKHRSQAAAIAQQDQDRMRAMTVAELSNHRLTRTPEFADVTFTVRSSATWITDDTGSATCTSGQAGANYLRISSTVTWPNMRVQPVTVESLVAPPAGSFGPGFGSLAVQVNNGRGEGVPGVVGSLTGALGYTDVTNENGCILWAYLPVGDYNVTISKPSYVDPSLVSTPTKSVTVASEATVTLSFDYDVAGTLNVGFETLAGAGGSVVAPAGSNSFMLEASGLSAPLGPFTGSPGPLYPYSGGYGVYAGTCAGARPGTVPTVVVPPNGNARATVRVLLIDIRVTNGSNGITNGTVFLTGTGTGCGVMASRPTVGTTSTGGYLATNDRGYPYGTYSFCVQGQVGGTWYRATRANSGATSISNASANGVANSSAVSFDLGSTRYRVAGRCA